MEADLGVLGVRDEPVDGGKVLPLGELLVQAPKHLQGHRHTLKQCVATGNVNWTIPKDTHSDSVWHQAAASKPCVRADVHATEVSTRAGQAVVLKSHDHWALWRLSLMTMRTVYLMCRHL